MYKINSGFRWTTTAETEREIFALALAPEDIDSDLQQLEEHRLNNVGQLNHNCEMDSNKKLTKTQSEQELEYLLSNLLKYGVLIASAVVLLGVYCICFITVLNLQNISFFEVHHLSFTPQEV
ncbi:hypothetical protein DSM107003_25620 [Trichormus variabilis SAG 1403-4b]|uniref:Uncharacterized protein n=1 Tax=Trichormus variabilis SAG 1403-4b TaxID=447716 RepID=A0A3S1C727_ANAVA|nr:hypothetical protein DSM107003_25620 [Trichormus variabilis SAG 1403-4b]